MRGRFGLLSGLLEGEIRGHDPDVDQKEKQLNRKPIAKSPLCHIELHQLLMEIKTHDFVYFYHADLILLFMDFQLWN